jgi:hypothetical protein
MRHGMSEVFNNSFDGPSAPKGGALVLSSKTSSATGRW